MTLSSHWSFLYKSVNLFSLNSNVPVHSLKLLLERSFRTLIACTRAHLSRKSDLVLATPPSASAARTQNLHPLADAGLACTRAHPSRKSDLVLATPPSASAARTQNLHTLPDAGLACTRAHLSRKSDLVLATSPGLRCTNSKPAFPEF